MDVPRVMQAPIGPATTTDLVVAVSCAGGLGTLAGSWTPLGALGEQVRELQRRLDRPFCVNLVLSFDQHERVELLAELGVPAISFSWGVEPALIARARAAGAMVLVQVGDLPAGLRAAELGADILIAQGVEAGGHVQSKLPLVQLLRQLRPRIGLPLIAAGGIADRPSINQAMATGADAVAAGSAYLVATEADVHPTYHDLVIQGRGDQTLVSELFDVGWPNAPHRTLHNSTAQTWIAAGRPAPRARPGEGEEVAVRAGRTIVRYSDAQPTRDTTGDIAAMALYAGRGIDSITEPADAATITQRLLFEASPPPR